MTTTVKSRVAIFSLLIVMLTLMIGGAAHFGWRQFEQMRDKLQSSPIESFSSAIKLRATIEELDYLLLRYDLRHNEADWNRFFPESKKLDAWIDEQQPTLTTPQERAIFTNINVTYDFYQEAAHRLHHDITNSASNATQPG